jgi:hypothetical protein
VTSTRRHIDSSAVSAFLPVAAVIPLWLLALAIVWLPLRVVWHISFITFAIGYLCAALLLFLRPVQVLLLAPLLGARRPTRLQSRPGCWRSSTRGSSAVCSPTSSAITSGRTPWP